MLCLRCVYFWLAIAALGAPRAATKEGVVLSLGERLRRSQAVGGPRGPLRPLRRPSSHLADLPIGQHGHPPASLAKIKRNRLDCQERSKPCKEIFPMRGRAVLPASS